MFFHRRTVALAPIDAVTRRQVEVTWLVATLRLSQKGAAQLAFLGWLWEHGEFDPPCSDVARLAEGFLIR